MLKKKTSFLFAICLCSEVGRYEFENLARMMVEFLFGLLLATSSSMLFAYCKIVRISLPGLKNQESFIIIYFLFTYSIPVTKVHVQA